MICRQYLFASANVSKLAWGCAITKCCKMAKDEEKRFSSYMHHRHANGEKQANGNGPTGAALKLE